MEMKKQDGIELIDRIASHKNIWAAYKKVKSNGGAPQGGRLSPILANVYLNKLDRKLEKREHCFIRYADDFVIFIKSPRAGEIVMASIGKFIEGELGLTINEKKSKVCGAIASIFLGFHLQNLRGKFDADQVKVDLMKEYSFFYCIEK